MPWRSDVTIRGRRGQTLMLDTNYGRARILGELINKCFDDDFSNGWTQVTFG